MRPRLLLTVLLTGALVPAGLAGCGIPDQTEVQVDGRGPAAESGSLNGGGARRPPTPKDSNEPGPFIENYLRAAAAGEREQAYARVKDFVAPEAKDDLREKKQSSEIELTVVRLRESPEVTPPNNEGTSRVTVKVQQVGVLRADGTLDTPVASETTYEFRLRRVDPARPELAITSLPNVLLVTDTALREYYRMHTIYFWNSDQTRLVPDQRYLSSAVPAERRVTEVVRWLAGGPPDWLASGVTRLPDGTAPINNATGSDGRWEVNLSMNGANDARLAKLATQLAWSLPAELTGQLDLKIQNQKRLTVDLKQERATRPAYPAGERPLRFGVYDGAIHPLSFAGEPIGSVPVEAPRNRNVVSAALGRSGDQVLAAMVVTRPDQKLQLRVGSGPGPVTVFNDSKDSYGTIGRPTWIRSLDPDRPGGLVAAGGRLYRFDGAAVMSPVALNVRGRVTAVAGSLEGHRVALVIGGNLYVAPVSIDGGAISVGRPRQLVTRLTGVTGVDWIAENELLFAGNEDGRPAIYQTTVDGAQETPIERDIGAEVTQLAAYPGGVVGAVPAFSYMYEANRAAYRNNPFGIIKREQVQGVPTPAPGAKAANPTAPFFYY